MKDLPPIPTPLGLRWREFRIRFLPLLVVLVATLAVVYLWTRHVTPATLVGEAEIVRAHVSCRLPGTVTQLSVAPFSPVRAGDSLAQVIVADPRVLSSTLAVIQAEVELLRASSDPLLTRERNRLDYERLRLALLEQRTTLAANRVHLQFAQSELRRVQSLRGGNTLTNITSESEYEIALRDRDALQREIEERERAVTEIEGDLGRLPAAALTNLVDTDAQSLRAALNLQEQRIRLAEAELSPITLTAPIAGTVSMVYRRTGETVVAGEPILTIVSPVSDRIVGYLLPPLGVEPVVGMRVRVQARTPQRTFGWGEVTEVAPHMDLVPSTIITPATLSRGTFGLDNRPNGGGLNGNTQPAVVGVPIAVSVPPGMSLRPGELVDLTLAADPR